MKPARFLSLAFLILIFAFSALSYGAVPQMINYQGKLTTPAGALMDTTIQVVFTIYDDSTSGNVLWADTLSSVEVEKGIFSVLLGSGNPIPDSVFPGDIRYLGVKVGTDLEMTPRKEIVSVGYAFHSATSDTAMYAVVGGLASVDGVSNPGGDVDLIAGSNMTITPNDGANTITFSATTGGIGGSGTANYIPKFTASTTLGNSVVYETGSRIGIGTTSPNANAKLHVAGTSYYAGYFKSNKLSGSTHVIHSEFTGSGTYDARAVYGKSTPADYYGYGGYFEGGYTGVEGRVLPNPSASSSYYGVRGYVSGGSGTNYAVYGYAGFGSTNYAGYFAGNARVVGTLSKGGGSFQIDHPLEPENKYLFHSFVESPDMMNVYNGNMILDANGGAVVQLPDYFEALNRDFRYQLTAIGAPGPNLYIAAKIAHNQFTIAGGEPGMEVSWQVTGVRHDKFAEANRIQVEVDKPEDERGKYLHPEAYKLGEEYDIHYEQNKRMKEKEDQRKLD